MENAPLAIADDVFRRARERLERLVRVESPTFDRESSETIAGMLAGWWRGLGADIRLVRTEAGTSLVADLPGRGRPVLLVGHSDTVWPRGTLEAEMPLRADGDVLRGPGVYDMKSGLVTMLAAVEATSGAERRSVRVVVVADEEVGSPTTTPLLREVSAGVSAVLGFESPHRDGALKVGRRGSTRVRVRVTGRAAHAALDPETGISAIDELVDQLGVVRDITTDPALPSEVLCNVGAISGGARANVVPAHAEAEIGLRFVDGDAQDRVLGALRALAPVRAGAIVDVDVLSHRAAWTASDGDRAVARDLARAAARRGQTLDARPAAGAGDTNSLGSWGLSTVDGLGPRGGGAHAVSEHILLSSLGERVALLAEFLVATDDVAPVPTAKDM